MICRPWVPEEADDFTTSTRLSWLLTTLHTAFRIQSDGKYVRKNADTLVGRPNQGERNYNASSTTQVLGFGFGEGRKRLSLFVDGFIIDSVDKLRLALRMARYQKNGWQRGAGMTRVQILLSGFGELLSQVEGRVDRIVRGFIQELANS